MSDTLDVITLTEAKTALNITTTTHDTPLAMFITSVSRRMDKLCGPIVVQSAITEYHDGGDYFIVPRKTPVSSITSLTEADGTTTTALTEETFGVEPADAYIQLSNDKYVHDYQIVRRETGADAQFATGRRNIKLIYVPGRAATTAAVDARFKQVALEILRRLWQREAGAWSRAQDPFDEGLQLSSRFFNAVDHVIKELLSDETVLPGFA